MIQGMAEDGRYGERPCRGPGRPEICWPAGRLHANELKAVTMISTVSTLKSITNNMTRSIEVVAKTPPVERETEYYLSKIGDIKSVDEFMADRRIYSYALRAFGMSDMVPSRALVRKVLSEGIDDRKSLANSLADSRFREFVEVFNFARNGSATTAFSRTQQGTVDRFLRQTLEENAGTTNEGVRLALYFQRKAPTISSVYQILADRALYKVVETALSLPSALPAAGIEKQAAAISRKLDISSLKDPAKLGVFITRFANLWDLGQSSSVSSPTLALFNGRAGNLVSSETLASIQNLKLTRR